MQKTNKQKNILNTDIFDKQLFSDIGNVIRSQKKPVFSKYHGKNDIDEFLLLNSN